MSSVEKAFEVIDHTADIGIVVYGADIKQVFVNAAVGLFNLILDTDSVKETIEHNLELSSQDTESLLVEWLNELIYVLDAEHMVFRSFEVDQLGSSRIKARCFGEKIDPQRHVFKREIKAATYHMLTVDREHNGYKAQVIFDV